MKRKWQNLFLAQLNPQHKIPTIVDDGFVLSESGAIVTYLANKYAKDNNSNIYPKDVKTRAVVEQRIYFNMVLFSACADILVCIGF